MNLRYLLLISILVTACVFSSCSRAEETTNSKDPKVLKAQCDRGDAKACLSLGAMYNEGTGVTQDFAQAVEFYRKACDGGSALGCDNLGVRYELGMGVKQSNTDALNYYGKACDLKDENGCEYYARIKKKR